MLNVRGEKVSEVLFLGALIKAVAQWPGAQLVDYSCAETTYWLPHIWVNMPVMKGLLAPQNTFLDTIATRFDGTRK
ncbi:hypothetical protein GOODEAATRI_016594 [Goodea atripinnis]|uniref:Uncharacterized protein n=1 Tax=Goodea atripinnis TaxID=208336 RepID=A0ABV0N217_9TELE